MIFTVERVKESNYSVHDSFIQFPSSSYPMNKKKYFKKIPKLIINFSLDLITHMYSYNKNFLSIIIINLSFFSFAQRKGKRKNPSVSLPNIASTRLLCVLARSCIL